MKRHRFLFAAAFCLPIFSALAAGAGRPVVRAAPLIAAAAPAPAPAAANVAGRFGRNHVFSYELTSDARDSRDLPVYLACIEVTVHGHPDAGKPPEVVRLPLARDPLRTVSFSIPMGGHAVLRAIAEDGSVSEPLECSWMPSRRSCCIDYRRVTPLRRTFRFPAR